MEQAAQLAERVLHRCAGEGYAARGVEQQQAARALGVRILDGLRLIQHQGGQVLCRQQFSQAGGHAVGGERHMCPLQQPAWILLQVVAILSVQHVRVQHQGVELRGELP